MGSLYKPAIIEGKEVSEAGTYVSARFGTHQMPSVEHYK